MERERESDDPLNDDMSPARVAMYIKDYIRYKARFVLTATVTFD